MTNRTILSGINPKWEKQLKKKQKWKRESVRVEEGGILEGN